jgi:AraC-like DNA-binding protein
MPLSLLDALLRGTLVALLLLMALLLLRDRPRLAAARAAAALCAGLVVQTLSATPWFEAHAPRAVQAPLVAVSVANAVLFWIFVGSLFDDAFRWRAVHGLAWAGTAVLAGVNCATGANGTSSGAGGFALADLAVGLQRAVPLVCAGLATWAAARHWREDLVEGRRWVRGFIAVAGVGYTLVTLAARLASPDGRLSALGATADVAALLLIVLPAAWWLLGVGGGDLFPSAHPADVPAPPAVPRSPAPEPVPDPADERLAGALQRLMQHEQAYRHEDLSIALLARRLAVPEYRLRRHIHQQLGHRNFNAYINGLRLADARAALADPAQRAQPVLSIALDAGFQSIGPFNRAFKAATGLTPSEFRRQKLADS